MKTFWALGSYLKNNLHAVIPFTALAAVITGNFLDFSSLKSMILPVTLLVVFPMMIDFPLRSVFSRDDTRVLLCAQLLNYAVIPFIGYVLAVIFFQNHAAFALGLLMLALMPTSGGMTIAWTGYARGNIQASIKMTVLGLLLGALFAPFYIKLLMGKTLLIPLKTIVRQVFVIVLVPLVAGQITRFVLIHHFDIRDYEEKIKPRISALSVFGLISLIFVASGLKAKAVTNDPLVIVTLIPPLLAFYGLTYLITSLFGKIFLDRENAISLVYSTSLRSLGLALVLSLTVLGEHGAEIALMIALAFVIQIQSATWFMKVSECMYHERRGLRG